MTSSAHDAEPLLPSLPRSQLNLTEEFTPEYLEQYGILPIEVRGGRLLLAAEAPPPAEVAEDLLGLYGAREIEVVRTDRSALSQEITRVFSAADSSSALLDSLAGTVGAVQPDPSPEWADTRDLVNQPPVIRYVSLLIREAHDARASDIHLEVTDQGLRVRLRIDGVLSDLPSPPSHLHAAILTRIKLLAHLDIANRRSGQDGRIRLRLDQRMLDLRVATLPVAGGETVTLRLLDHGGHPVTLEDLGMTSEILQPFRRLAERPNGILMVTGPTGSGKTTTLHAALGLRDAAREKVITIEDPVEYQLPRAVQIAVDEEHGLSFAMALRSVLRHDPDVLLVGEMRDPETARIAVQAAMTGHLVLTSLHTNDAVSAIARLADLGIEPYLIAATIEGVLAQRLVRRICGRCRERYRPDDALVELVAGRAGSSDGAMQYQRGAGCRDCRGTGFRGRVGLFELYRMSDTARSRVAHGATIQELGEQARAEGMRLLVEDGWRKVVLGITTVEEVARAVGV